MVVFDFSCLDSIENARKKYMPSIVKVLFIGESAPAGGTFFYYANSRLFRSVKDVFNEYSSTQLDGENFLNYLMNNGYYLDDLCLEPINNLDNRSKKQKRNEWIESLSIRVKQYYPKSIIIIGKAIEPYVVRSLALIEGYQPHLLRSIPFPYPGKAKGQDLDTVTRFKIELKSVLEELQNSM